MRNLLPLVDMKQEKRYWLLKSEPTCYSIDDLKHDKKAVWSGVRNYQARNFIRDGMKKGDGVLFYHSSSNPSEVVGIAKIVSNPFSDPTASNKKSEYFDPKSTVENPIWYAVEVGFVKKLQNPVTLQRIKTDNSLKNMAVAQKGSRLSVMPVLEKHFHFFENF